MQGLKPIIYNNIIPIQIEEVDNCVVHSITKEIITKYKKLISNPLLQDNWMKSMCKELRRLFQGCGEEGTDEYTKGTNIVLCVDFGQHLIDSKRRSGNAYTTCGGF